MLRGVPSRKVQASMLQASCSKGARGIVHTKARASIASSSEFLGLSKPSVTRPEKKRREAPQKVHAQAFFDRVFKRQERHAPELVRLDTDDEGGLGQTSAELFGPLAVLMVGFHEDEIQAFRSVMLDMEADMVKIIICDRHMFQQTLRQALEAPGHMHTQVNFAADWLTSRNLMPSNLPDFLILQLVILRIGQRAMILSGMNAAEVGEIIGAYRDAGLPEPVWAAALAANWDRKVKDLVDDIYGDHRYMMERESKTERP